MFTLLNGAILAGLSAVVIPPILHLLNRKRFDTVDWAAMQFLQMSEQTRRKVFIEELLLMLVRMGLIAILVLGLAAPVAQSEIFSRLGMRSSRDVVMIADGSGSMAFRSDDKSAQDAAREWANSFLDELQAGDGVGLVQAKQSPSAIIPGLTPNLTSVREALQDLSAPRGGVDWPASIQMGVQLLSNSKQPRRELIVLSDGQRQGWIDERTQERFELLAKKLQAEGTELPRIWVVNVTGDRPTSVANWSFADMRTSRATAVVGREVKFRTALRLSGEQDLQPPPKLARQIDNRPAGEVPILARSALRGQVPVTFSHRFAVPGYHLVTLELPDDALPGDNRQDFAIEVVPSIPALVVDGDSRSAIKDRGSDFLRDALAPARDPSPAFVLKIVPIGQFDGAMLTRPVGKEPSSLPRMLILSNVDRLTPDQMRAIEAFLQGGGGVMVALGDRADTDFYNTELFRDGQGWLPAKLVQTVGDVNELNKAAKPQAASMNHPALELFREPTPGGLETAYFPRHWKLNTPANTPGTVIAVLSDRDPLFVERAFGKGKVIVSAVPLDNGWRTNLPDLVDFPRLAHELGYYLAGTRGPSLNLAPGQPLIFRPFTDEKPTSVTIQPPGGTPKRIDVKAWPLVYEETREPGVYELKTEGGQIAYFVVNSDSRESEMKPLDDADREKLTKLYPSMKFVKEIPEVMEELNRETTQQELWWLFMLAVVGMLLAEIWMTRRIALNQR